jgi:hypothetical protein
MKDKYKIYEEVILLILYQLIILIQLLLLSDLGEKRADQQKKYF